MFYHSIVISLHSSFFLLDYTVQAAITIEILQKERYRFARTSNFIMIVRGDCGKRNQQNFDFITPVRYLYFNQTLETDLFQIS